MTDEIESLISGASTEQLRRLLALAKPQAQATDAVIAALADPAELAGVLEELVPGSGAGERWVATLMQPAATLTDLQDLRERAKKLSSEAKRAGHIEGQAAADLLYHAAVVCAYLRHGATISTRPLGERRKLYAQLAEWLESGPLAQLFAEIVRKV